MSSTGYTHFWMRPQLHIGAGAVVRLSAILKEVGARRVALVSDKGIAAAGVLEPVKQVFSDNPFPTQPQLVGIYDDVQPDATSTCINEVIQFARSVDADAIVAIGGGSVLDTAKAVRYCLHHHIADITPVIAEGFRIETSPPATASSIPLIAVPTTAGTGADVSNGSIIFDVTTQTKCVLVAPYFEPDISILDPMLSRGLPPSITADTGMDALTHALECLCTVKANPMSDTMAFGAIRLIRKNLPTAVNDGKNLDARQNMLQAAVQAIEGMGHAVGANLVHNCSHAYGALFHIPHGRANSVFLPVVLEEVPEYYLPHAEKLAESFAINTDGMDADAMLQATIKGIRDLQAECHCPTDFSEFKLNPADFEKMVMGIMTDPLYAFYPIPQEKVVRIVQRVMGQA
jgi:alcohol dehydrogenase class IV